MEQPLDELGVVDVWLNFDVPARIDRSPDRMTILPGVTPLSKVPLDAIQALHVVVFFRIGGE
ncbi:hypothetical protein D3C72_1401060 [compost metagenome]